MSLEVVGAGALSGSGDCDAWLTALRTYALLVKAETQHRQDAQAELRRELTQQHVEGMQSLQDMLKRCADDLFNAVDKVARELAVTEHKLRQESSLGLAGSLASPKQLDHPQGSAVEMSQLRHVVEASQAEMRRGEMAAEAARSTQAHIADELSRKVNDLTLKASRAEADILQLRARGTSHSEDGSLRAKIRAEVLSCAEQFKGETAGETHQRRDVSPDGSMARTVGALAARISALEKHREVMSVKLFSLETASAKKGDADSANRIASLEAALRRDVDGEQVQPGGSMRLRSRERPQADHPAQAMPMPGSPTRAGQPISLRLDAVEMDVQRMTNELRGSVGSIRQEMATLKGQLPAAPGMVAGRPQSPQRGGYSFTYAVARPPRGERPSIREQPPVPVADAQAGAWHGQMSAVLPPAIQGPGSAARASSPVRELGRACSPTRVSMAVQPAVLGGYSMEPTVSGGRGQAHLAVVPSPPLAAGTPLQGTPLHGTPLQGTPLRGGGLGGSVQVIAGVTSLDNATSAAPSPASASFAGHEETPCGASASIDVPSATDGFRHTLAATQSNLVKAVSEVYRPSRGREQSPARRGGYSTVSFDHKDSILHM